MIGIAGTSKHDLTIPQQLKNTIVSAYQEWNNNAVGIVSYGSTGGACAAEHLPGILAEL